MPFKVKTTMPGPVPEEALAYFRSKKLKVGFSYLDVWREEHAFAWTVAKAMTADVLDSIRGAVDGAIADGTTFRQFKKDLTPVLQGLGWWGEQPMIDPLTGERPTVELGSPRRLKIIYDTNLRVARSVGQWQRIQRTKRTHPYLLYQLGPSQRHRPEHAGWEGTLLPADDPWWDFHYTPNGWGCKCWIRQVSRGEAARIGVTPRRPSSRTVEWVNGRTGEVSRVPVGIDPGWDYNPGKERGKPFAQRAPIPGRAKTSEEWAAGMKSEKVIKAFQDWIGTEYTNMRLVDKGGSLGSVDATKTVVDKLKLIREGLAKAPVYAGTVYRGIGGLTKEQVTSMAVKGSTIELDAISSFSKKRTVAKQFIGQEYGRNVILEIKTSKGGAYAIDIAKLAGDEVEVAEVLVEKGKRLQVVKSELIREKGMMGGESVWTHITLEEL